MLIIKVPCIAFWQINTEGVGTFFLINTIDSIYPTLTPILYPKVGTTNPAASIGVVSLEDGKISFMEIKGDKRNNYLTRMYWAAEFRQHTKCGSRMEKPDFQSLSPLT